MCVSFPAWCALNTSVEYRLSMEGLKDIQKKLIKAQNRSDEMMEQPYIHAVHDGSNPVPVYVVCPPHFPDRGGEGCELNFMAGKTTSMERFNFTISKPVELSTLEKSRESIEVKLKRLPSSSESLNFGNPFSASPNRLNYSCRPDPSGKVKGWVCYLSVHEKV